MKELNDIILAYDKAISQNKQTALVTVVMVEGSSYRRPGARMLVTEDGDITGAISGGCLEGDALRKAQFAMFEQKNKLEIYDTTDEEDIKLGIQLGCNGIVYILFEPINSNEQGNPINLLKKVAEHRNNAVLVTLFNPDKSLIQKGTCGYVNDAESFFIADEMSPLKSECINLLTQRSSFVKHYEGSCSVLFQFIPPAIQLVIVGAGNDTQPLEEIAFILGWKIIVVDGRPTHASQQRFPLASKVIVCRPTEVLLNVTTDELTAVVLMTHNYNYDLALLEQLLTSNCAYVGVLGPKKKLYKMFDELNEKGIVMTKELTDKIYGPVGLDIGAETSEEIAASIIVEIRAVFSGRSGTLLKDRKATIHNNLIMHD